MPSGAKKRKAAKKKKEKGASTTNKPSSTSHSHGDENRKHHESDGGEVSDHHNSEHHLTEGEEEEVEKKNEDNSRVEGSKSVDDVKNDDRKVEKRAAEEEGVVQIERELKQDDQFDKKKGGSSKSSSSSSSSDDESHAVKKDIVVIDNAPVVDSVEAVNTFSEGPSQVTHTTPVRKFEDYAEKISSLDEKVLEGSGASAVNSLSSDVGGQKENGERKLSSLEVNSRLPEVVKDLAPQNKKDKVANVAAASDAKESAAHESEEKLTLSYNAPRDDAIKDAEHVKDSEFLGSSERQPLIASAARPVQTTSWKSCCGLFEVFRGSNT